MADITIAIDNGLTGAIVVNYGGAIVEMYEMPVLSVRKRTTLKPRKKGKGGQTLKKQYNYSNKRFVDILAVHRLIRNEKSPTVIIEKPAGSKSLNAAKSMQESWARLDTMFLMMGIKPIHIRAADWQRFFWSKEAAKDTDTKLLAYTHANILWPNQQWIKSKVAGNIHDGVIDAALMTYWATHNNITHCPECSGLKYNQAGLNCPTCNAKGYICQTKN